MTRIRREDVFEHEIHNYLTRRGYALEILDQAEHQAIEQHWASIYGNRIGYPNWRFRAGMRALAEYRRIEMRELLVVPFLTADLAPCVAPTVFVPAAACFGEPPPDLCQFQAVEFFISPPDLSWTLVHTHEDGAYTNGPLFAREEWMVPPCRRHNPRGDRRTRRRD